MSEFPGSNGQEASWELLRTCTAGGSEMAWREFASRYEERLIGLLRWLSWRAGSRDETIRVEDLLQEVYCRLLAGRERPSRRFRGGTEGEAEAYLRRVARSVVLDARRDEAAAKRGGGRVVRLSEHDFGRRQPIAPEPGAEARLLGRERRRLFLRACRAALGRRAAATSLRIVELALCEGWTSREIAATLPDGPSAAAIDSLIHRLRRRFEESGNGIPRRARPPRTPGRVAVGARGGAVG